MWRKIHIVWQIGSFWTQKQFGYKYGAGFRGKNSENLGQNISEVDEDFGTNEHRNVIGIIAIHGEEIFISGQEMFIEYILLREFRKS